jgi:hypothetical protein
MVEIIEPAVIHFTSAWPNLLSEYSLKAPTIYAPIIKDRINPKVGFSTYPKPPPIVNHGIPINPPSAYTIAEIAPFFLPSKIPARITNVSCKVKLPTTGAGILINAPMAIIVVINAILVKSLIFILSLLYSYTS